MADQLTEESAAQDADKTADEEAEVAELKIFRELSERIGVLTFDGGSQSLECLFSRTEAGGDTRQAPQLIDSSFFEDWRRKAPAHTDARQQAKLRAQPVADKLAALLDSSGGELGSEQVCVSRPERPERRLERPSISSEVGNGVTRLADFPHQRLGCGLFVTHRRSPFSIQIQDSDAGTAPVALTANLASVVPAVDWLGA